MKCPLCNVELKIAERQGIEIDYCPQCRGVWLDRGELDKIIERSHSALNEGNSPIIERKEIYDDKKHYKNYEHDDDYYKRKKENRSLKICLTSKRF